MIVVGMVLYCYWQSGWDYKVLFPLAFPPPWEDQLFIKRKCGSMDEECWVPSESTTQMKGLRTNESEKASKSEEERYPGYGGHVHIMKYEPRKYK